MPGPHKGPQGPKPVIKNPGRLFKRLLGIIFEKYDCPYGLFVLV